MTLEKTTILQQASNALSTMEHTSFSFTCTRMIRANFLSCALKKNDGTTEELSAYANVPYMNQNVVYESSMVTIVQLKEGKKFSSVTVVPSALPLPASYFAVL